MADPDWDRWHELMDILSVRAFTRAESVEYVEFRRLVAKLDAEEARVGKASIKKIAGDEVNDGMDD